MEKNRRDGIESRVRNASNLIKKDEGGYYLPICDYFHHVGVIINEQTCVNRSCPHYDKHYLAHQDVNYRVCKSQPVIPNNEIDSIFEKDECDNIE